MTALACLSTRELQVFDQIAVGTPPQQIADVLCLSVKTVSTYRARVLEKLGLKSNAQIARLHAEEALALAADHTLFAAAVCAGVARWESLGETSGEVIFDGLRYCTHIDAHGVPYLYEHMRVRLGQALECARSVQASAA